MDKKSLILAILVGAILGVFVIFPMNEAIFYYEHIRLNPNAPTLKNFILDEFDFLLHRKGLVILIFYLLSGAIISLITTTIHSKFADKNKLLMQLSEELGKDISDVIAQGEGSRIEFKSSFRWDYRHSKVNRVLETVVLKTIAGFMNSNGGSLVVGVADDKQIMGLKNDYQTLKKSDRDGFEQAVITSISTNLGANVCRNIHIIFHTIDNEEICRLIVTTSERPVYLKHEGKLKLFVRTGGGTRELNIQESVEYIAAHWD